MIWKWKRYKITINNDIRNDIMLKQQYKWNKNKDYIKWNKISMK